MDTNIIIRVIDKQHSADINIPNQPFELFGKLLPSYTNGNWEYQIIRFKDEEITEMCFPNENYDFDTLSSNSIILGAYDQEMCIGIAILQHAWNKYMYLYDLKVDINYRNKQVASLLIAEAKEVSKKHNYRGIFTQGQDNNLGACLFYLKNGFVIGGMDTNIYKGTLQEGKSDIHFYADI